MANESISRGIDNYLEKVHCLLACLNCGEWIATAHGHSIEMLFNTALEIEECMSKAEAQKILESLKVVFPEYNFTRCGDIVLEAVLVHPQTQEETLTNAIEKYLQIYDSQYFCNLLFRLMQSKKVKDQAMNVISNYGNGKLIQTFEARCCLHLCEQMIADGNPGLENYVKELLEKETLLCINSLTLSSFETGRVISEVILKLLKEDRELKLWFNMLNPKNIKDTSFLCIQYPELMKAMLEFFESYAAEAEYGGGKPFSWSHKLIPLNEFVDVLHFFLANDGLVGATVNDFLTNKIIGLKDDFSFWLDVKALL